MRLRAVSAGILCAGAVAAQTARQPIPPIRPLGRIIATTTVPLQRITQLRVLSDGRVLVHDQIARHVLLFDADLAHAKSVIDTSSETSKAYGGGGGGLFPFLGDSSLWLDIGSWALLIVDPVGKIVRTVAAPPNPGVPAFGPNFLINPLPSTTFDGRGRLVYVNQFGPHPFRMFDSAFLPVSAGPTIPQDSLPITRIIVGERDLDTVGWVSRTPGYNVTLADGSQGMQAGNPLYENDDWTVLADGTVAIVREHDYHIDWIGADKKMTSSPKIAHEWIHLTDSMKEAMIDSARLADSLKAVQDTIAQGGLKGILAKMPPLSQFPGAAPAATRAQQQIARLFDRRYVPPTVLPDYLPPFLVSTKAVLADADGNVWIRVNLSHPPDGGPAFDVVNRAGVLVDRVQIPGATTIVGFGPGVVYLSAREGTGMQLARARVR